MVESSENRSPSGAWGLAGTSTPPGPLDVIAAGLQGLDDEGLKTVGQMLKDQWRRRGVQRTHAAMAQWALGQAVEFTPRQGPPQRGTIEKFGAKNVKVHVSDGTSWLVDPTLLRTPPHGTEGTAQKERTHPLTNSLIDEFD